MKLLLNAYLLLITSFHVVGCRETLKSSVNPDLVNAKNEGKDIKSALNYYFINSGRFPKTLDQINLARSSDRRRYYWVYSVTDGGMKCKLITNTRVDGYFVFLDKNGHITASTGLPQDSEILWTGHLERPPEERDRQ